VPFIGDSPSPKRICAPLERADARIQLDGPFKFRTASGNRQNLKASERLGSVPGREEGGAVRTAGVVIEPETMAFEDRSTAQPNGEVVRFGGDLPEDAEVVLARVTSNLPNTDIELAGELAVDRVEAAGVMAVVRLELP